MEAAFPTANNNAIASLCCCIYNTNRDRRCIFRSERTWWCAQSFLKAFTANALWKMCSYRQWKNKPRAGARENLNETESRFEMEWNKFDRREVCSNVSKYSDSQNGLASGNIRKVQCVTCQTTETIRNSQISRLPVKILHGIQTHPILIDQNYCLQQHEVHSDDR